MNAVERSKAVPAVPSVRLSAKTCPSGDVVASLPTVMSVAVQDVPSVRDWMTRLCASDETYSNGCVPELTIGKAKYAPLTVSPDQEFAGSPDVQLCDGNPMPKPTVVAELNDMTHDTRNQPA